MKIIYKEENILNIPNLLSFYRLLVFPLILFFVISGNEKLFIVFIGISLITDFFDGFIARKFNMQTRFGLALDNVADIGTLFTAMYGIFYFKWDAFKDHAWILYVFFIIFIISYIVSYIRFKRVPGLHLYGSVASAYIMIFFMLILFVWGFIPWLFYVAVGAGILAYIEKILILLKLKDIRPGVKGLYWLMKEGKEGK